MRSFIQTAATLSRARSVPPWTGYPGWLDRNPTRGPRGRPAAARFLHLIWLKSPPTLPPLVGPARGDPHPPAVFDHPRALPGLLPSLLPSKLQVAAVQVVMAQAA
jgi:hypothetical protein